MTAVTKPDLAVVDRIARRAFAHMVAMIHVANHRPDADKTDPKVGGHPAACASCLDFLTALHLMVREPGDYICGKPHSSPVDHALHHALGLFRHKDGNWFSVEESEAIMHRLRSFSFDGKPVFQSYHAEGDADSWRYLPSGSVGIPPVVAAYLALAYRYARQHGWDVDEPHFWCMMGDSEFREGSLLEVLPEVAERELGNVTWIIDYNRQNLDGTRIPNNRGLQGTDADRIERTAVANGWQVIQLRHGTFREQVFAKKGGDALRKVFENGLTDYHYQALVWKRDAKLMREALLAADKACKPAIEKLGDDDLIRLFFDTGGHDHAACRRAFEQAKVDKLRPTLIIAHTIKGRGLECVAANGNHSAMPEESEVQAILAAEGLSLDNPFGRLDPDSEEGRFATQRGLELRLGIEALEAQAEANREKVVAQVEEVGGLPASLDINLKLAPTTHTQWMWGQLAAKLVRIGVFDELQRAGKEHKAGKALTQDEAKWNPLADLMMTMAPDVGTSTNINPAMDEKIFGPKHDENWESKLDLHERLRPELAPTDEAWTRHIRFEIAEANCMTAVGSFGKMDHAAGIPFLPMMTVYDFFIKRALDQLYYNLYWGSSFVLVGTPSGITLAPEGAQHSWKSDIQIPNLITWEPAYAIEMEWILCDAIKRHFTRDNQGRTGVLIRAVTRALHQKELMAWLKRQAKWKREMPDGALLGYSTADGGLHEAEVPSAPDSEILAELQQHVLAGGYRLIDWRGYRGYESGENVVELFVMGALVPEAIGAAEQLLERGVYANVTVVTSPDLLCGELARKTGFAHLKQTLGVDGRLHLRPTGSAGGGSGALGAADVIDLAGRRVPVVSVHDGEIGLLDNIGSILGVPQLAKAVVKFSKSGTPAHIFAYHGLHAEGIAEACGQVLAETAMERVQLHSEAMAMLRQQRDAPAGDWRELWPKPE
ncbi:MAG: pyruvate dehydrogenase [Planctomycetes bacterium]|nr:pyruvate dehydrogenase [Planctomycetota bacterium]